MSYFHELKAENKKLKRILKDLMSQEYGRRNNWAGQWIECWNCHKQYAFGGNWNNLDPDKDMCPFCTAKEALK